MNLTQPEKRRVRVSSGTLPSPKVSSLAAFHPFSQQLDVIFPLDAALLNTLEALEAGYGKAKTRLSDILKNAEVFTAIEDGRELLAVSANLPQEEDVWCIDSRKHLTLSVSRSTYERLGLVGRKLPFKSHQDRHVIDIPLQKNTVSPANRERQSMSLELWDKRRESELGKDAALWEVLYTWKGEDRPQNIPFVGQATRRVQCNKRQLSDVFIPKLLLSPPPESPVLKSNTKKSKLAGDDETEALEDWNQRIEGLFEWVGMACLGAQRLRANDRVDPFVALYEPPEPSTVGTVIHLQWRGLLHPSFVQQVIDSVLSSLHNASSTVPFVSITCHALTSSPVSYLPYTTTPTGGLQPPTSVPAKLPRSDGEDTWSLILERAESEKVADGARDGSVRWCLAESVGQWDTRWG